MYTDPSGFTAQYVSPYFNFMRENTPSGSGFYYRGDWVTNHNGSFIDSRGNSYLAGGGTPGFFNSGPIAGVLFNDLSSIIEVLHYILAGITIEPISMYGKNYIIASDELMGFRGSIMGVAFTDSDIALFFGKGSEKLNGHNLGFNINTGIGVISSTLGGHYGLNSTQTFKYAIRQGGRVISAQQRTAIHLANSMKIANFLGRVNIVTGIFGTYHSGNMALTAYQEGGWEQVNAWDVSDAFVGAGGVVVGGLAMFGIISNPVGWGIGIGIGIYFTGRLVYDLSTNKN